MMLRSREEHDSEGRGMVQQLLTVLRRSSLCRTSSSSRSSSVTRTNTRLNRHLYATQASNVAPEPFLDFLYPGFGFFSRSLQPQSHQETLPAASESVIGDAQFYRHTPRSRNHQVRVLWDGQPGTFKTKRVDMCICGHSGRGCLGCRSSSSESPAVRQPSPSMEDLKNPVEDVVNEEYHRDHKVSGISIQKAKMDLQVYMERLDRFTPSLMGRVNRPRPRKGTRTHSNAILTVDDGRAALEQLWNLTAFLREAPQHEPCELREDIQLNLITLFSRIARSVEEPLEGWESTATRKTRSALTMEIKELRRLAAQSMQELINLPSFAPQASTRGPMAPGLVHRTAWALQTVDIACLLRTLPKLERNSATLDGKLVETPFILDLKEICKSSGPLGPKWKVTLRQIVTTFVLLEYWNTTADGAEQTLLFSAAFPLETHISESALERTGWNAKRQNLERNKLITLSDRFTQVLMRLEPTPFEYFRCKIESSAQKDHIEGVADALHFVNRAVAGCTTAQEILEVLHIWDLVHHAERGSTAAQVLTMSKIASKLLISGLLQDAEKLVKQMEDTLHAHDNDEAEISSSNAPLLEAKDAVYHLLMRLSSKHGRSDTIKSISEQTDAPRSNHTPVLQAIGRMEALSKSGKEGLREIRNLFTEAMTSDSLSLDDRRSLWVSLIEPHALANEADEARELYDQMLTCKVNPRRRILDALLQCYTSRTNVEDVEFVWNEYKRFNITRESTSYATLIRWFSWHNDLDNAVLVLEDMVAAGFRPTVKVYNSLLNSFIHNGQIPQALKLFTFLEKHADARMRPNTQTLNLLLRASNRTATPAKVGLKIFQTLLDRGLRPDMSTYCALMHTLCTVGLMHLAEELFSMMDAPPSQSRLPTSKDDTKPNALIFNMLIYGYLRRDFPLRAKAALSEMQFRGFGLDTITYGMVIQGFLNRGKMAMAIGLAKNFLTESRVRLQAAKDPSTLRGLDLSTIFGPIIQKFARRGDAAEALTYFEEVLKGDQRPSLLLYTSLMNAYRIEGKVENVLYLFNELHNSHTSKYAKVKVASNEMGSLPPGGSVHTITAFQANYLCIPFSIVIRALGEANDFDQLILLWKKLQSEQYMLDGGNWNDLAVAAIGCGKAEFALWICENILQGTPRFLGNTLPNEEENETSQRLFSGRFALPHGTAGSRLYTYRFVERLGYDNTDNLGDLLAKLDMADFDVVKKIRQIITNRQNKVARPSRIVLQYLKDTLIPVEEEGGKTHAEMNEGLLKALTQTYPKTMGRIRRLNWTRSTYQLRDEEKQVEL